IGLRWQKVLKPYRLCEVLTHSRTSESKVRSASALFATSHQVRIQPTCIACTFREGRHITHLDSRSKMFKIPSHVFQLAAKYLEFFNLLHVEKLIHALMNNELGTFTKHVHQKLHLADQLRQLFRLRYLHVIRIHSQQTGSGLFH